MSGDYRFSQLYGSNACTARRTVKLSNDAFKESLTEDFVLLDGKTRLEIDTSQLKHQGIPPAGKRQMGIDKEVIIQRPDLKATYLVFPRLKSYVKRQLSPDEAAVLDKGTKLEKTELGREEVDGHPCVKDKVILTTGDGQKHEVLVWLASDLKGFPVKVQLTDRGTIETTTFQEAQFIKPDAKLFEPPPGFTEYSDFMEMMEATQRGRSAELASTNVPVINVAGDQIAAVADFTLQKGTNRPISSATAKAFGLGDEKLPATQIMLARKGETTLHFFGVSARNTNDLFVARVDRNTRAGTVWLTSREGEIRATIVTSTNAAPEVVPNARYAEAFAKEAGLFIEFTAPPPWESVPHPLNVAAQFGSLQDVEKVLKQDPTALNMQDEEGMTPLAGAVVQAQVDVVRLLLEKGADPNIPNKNGLTPLEHACGRDQAAGMALAELLVARGAAVNPTNKTDWRIPLLEWAISSDNAELVKFLIEHGADVKAKSPNGDTPLHTAADRGDMEIAELLVACGADVNAKIIGGTTPLHKAAWGGGEAMVKFLLSKGAEADAKRTDGVTPLLEAAGPGAERHGKGCVELLLAKGADVHATDEHGDTPLHKAAYYGNKEVIECLLAHGAPINATNKNGQTPLQVAKKPDIIRSLREHGAKQ